MDCWNSLYLPRGGKDSLYPWAIKQTWEDLVLMAVIPVFSLIPISPRLKPALLFHDSWGYPSCYFLYFKSYPMVNFVITQTADLISFLWGPLRCFLFFPLLLYSILFYNFPLGTWSLVFQWEVSLLYSLYLWLKLVKFGPYVHIINLIVSTPLTGIIIPNIVPTGL